jgi:hypothetical protein
MNKGSFEKYAEVCLTYIYDLAHRDRDIASCIATTKYLASKLGKSTRQVTRYIKYLKENNKIQINTDSPKRDTITGKFYQKRQILPTCIKPKNSDEILAIYFDKRIKEEEKHLLIKKIVSRPYEYIKLTQVLEEATNNIETTMKATEQKQIYAQVYEEEHKKEIQQRFEKDQIYNKDKEVDRLVNTLVPYGVEGSTNLEKLVNWSINSYKNSCEYFGITREELEVLAGNVTLENNEYIVTIYLGGIIPHKLKFFKYFPYNKDSAEFKQFEQIFRSK